ncbi:MAG: tRNA (cytidine(56)-2'-O)-methyltransferase [Nanoarchaeota archaeon]|nr:tRNA (cytidine(56)-2'-O)-methyltransferase [Nanoarchaeota archaeon]MBU1445582.1 tRNA (cytidine(56)-2'-O)-methyltransferase [Nanoarchaeota archaeon]MBU2406949.1 tRNA (cytidine(56)-2'-O)-methyltransferase [Nanoarchaeota archaeon]MBU2420404.1 tRNA (cytidine(56)-2'-O)-methyltransferase [Nanoarchaeota archaeon]MBU2475797.1 tRNA (cytidine(56)-2'-O)-methyltransferase [Nanoarchaeota archaeon]
MIEVLRLSHRAGRDPRISTHVALVARAFLADKIYYSGDKDDSFEKSVVEVVKNFGGSFEIEYVKSALKLIKEKRKENFKIVNLTMYGEKIKKVKGDVLIVVGGEKVPMEVYHEADYNFSVTNQPHSEVGALAVLLHELNDGKELDFKFDGKIRIKPSKCGKEFE